MPVAPAATVSGAPRLPLPYGLFSVVPVQEAPGRWENGVQWEQVTCSAAGGISDPDYGPPVVPVNLDLGSTPNADGLGEASVFTVYGFFNGNPMGWSAEAAQNRAMEHLLAREEQRVEQALWTGDLGNTPTLAGSDTLASGVAQDMALGLGLLEEAIVASYGSLGVIHLTRRTALIALAHDLLVAKNGLLTTVLGTPVVAGSGYDGTSPDGDAAPDGQAWAYGTPAMFGLRTQPFTSSSIPGDLLDRGTNTLYSVAERTYLLGFDDCGSSAVLLKTT